VHRRNLTLTIDEDVLLAARKAALDRKTSVNQLVRDYLAQFAGATDEQKAAMARLEELYRTSEFEMGPRTWTREELHER